MPVQNVNVVNSLNLDKLPSSTDDPVYVSIVSPRFAGETGVNVQLNSLTKPFIYYFSLIDPSDGKILHEEFYSCYESAANSVLYQRAAHVSGWYINLKHDSLSTSDPVYVDVILSGGYLMQIDAHSLVRITYNYQSDTRKWKVSSISNLNYALTTI